MPAPGFDHTAFERELIRRFGGVPLQQFGVDGRVNGRPVEARVAKKDDRFRVGRDVHETLLAEGGSYIFDDLQDNQPPRMMDAAAVDGFLGPNWFEDRGYDHQFVETEEVFPKDDGDDVRRDPLFGLPI